MICKLKKNSNTVFNSQKIRMQYIKEKKKKEVGVRWGGVKDQTNKF